MSESCWLFVFYGVMSLLINRKPRFVYKFLFVEMPKLLIAVTFIIIHFNLINDNIKIFEVWPKHFYFLWFSLITFAVMICTFYSLITFMFYNYKQFLFLAPSLLWFCFANRIHDHQISLPAELLNLYFLFTCFDHKPYFCITIIWWSS